MPSVLQDWVMELPLRAQGTLLTGVRGCDLVPKLPLDSTARQLTGFLRFCVMNPADPREVGLPGAFFQPEPPEKWKPSELGHYPQHWISHIMHCYEVVAYRHPDPTIGRKAMEIYRRFVYSFHLNCETHAQWHSRMIEDRIASGTVVS